MKALKLGKEEDMIAQIFSRKIFNQQNVDIFGGIYDHELTKNSFERNCLIIFIF